MKKIFVLLCFIQLVWCMTYNGLYAQFNLTNCASPPALQDFNSFTGQAATLPTNWTAAPATYASAGTPNPLSGVAPPATPPNTNGIYALGPTGEFAMGGKVAAGAGSFILFTYEMINNTGNIVNSMTLDWDVEQYSRGGRQTIIDLEYNVNYGANVPVSAAQVLAAYTAGSTTMAYFSATAHRTITLTDLCLSPGKRMQLRFLIKTGTVGGSNNAHVGIDNFAITNITCSPCSATTAAPSPATDIKMCSPGGAIPAGISDPTTIPTCYSRIYLLARNSDNVIVASTTNSAALSSTLIVPANTSTTCTDELYTLHSLMYETEQGINIVNGTTTLSTITDNINPLTMQGGGNATPIAGTPDATACMSLSPAGPVITVYAPIKITYGTPSCNADGSYNQPFTVCGGSGTYTGSLAAGTGTVGAITAGAGTISNIPNTTTIQLKVDDNTTPTACTFTATANTAQTCATCAADASGFTATIDPTSFCQVGSILSGSSTTFSTGSFDYDVIYLLVDDATGIVVSSDFDVASLIAPDNNGTTVKTYSVYALVYEIAQDVVIINGTSTITVGDPAVIKDLDGDGLAASPTATACMDLSASAATVTVNPKPVLSDDIDDLNCSATGAAIGLASNASGTTITWTAVLTSGTATGFSDNATPTAVDNDTNTFEINSTLTNTGTTNAGVTYTITPAVNGCVGNNYVVPLTIFPPLTISTTETCSGTGEYDVSFTLAGGSGTGYNVSNSTGTLNYTAGATTGSVTAINVGTSLTLNAEDDEFCMSTGTASITLPTLSLVPSCAGGAGTGVLTPTFMAGESGTPTYNPATLTGLANNTYTVTVTESGSGCTATSSATINCGTATTVSVNADLTDPCYCIAPPTLDADNNVTANGTFGDEMIITTSPARSDLVWEVSASTATSPAVDATFTNNNDGTYTINIVYPAGAGGSAGSWSITAIETSGSGLAAQMMSGGSACAYTIGTLNDVTAPVCSAAAISLSATPSGGTWGGAATATGTYTPNPTTTAQGPFPYSYTYDAFPAVGAHAACPLTLNAAISVPACNASSCTPDGGTW